MSTVDHEKRLEQEVAALMGPLRAHYAEVEKEIERLQKQITSLRRTREEIRRLVRVTDIQFAARPQNGQPKKKKKGTGGISEEKLQTLTDWLQKRSKVLNEGKGFYGLQLLREYPPPESDLPFNNQSTLAKALRILHERGVIRLDGVGGSGGSKFYKTVMTATLFDFRDLDLMLKIAIEADGGISSQELAESIGLGEEGARAVGIRLAWMKRYGFVSLDDTKRKWGLSQSGERITASHLRAAQRRAITAVPDEALVEVMAHVTSRYRLGDPVMAQLLRREFLFGTQKRT